MSEAIEEFHCNLTFSRIFDRAAIGFLNPPRDVEEFVGSKFFMSVPGLFCFVRHGWSVNKFVVIKHPAWETTNIRMHTILNAFWESEFVCPLFVTKQYVPQQMNSFFATPLKAHKQGLVITVSRGLLSSTNKDPGWYKNLTS